MDPSPVLNSTLRLILNHNFIWHQNMSTYPMSGEMFVLELDNCNLWRHPSTGVVKNNTYWILNQKLRDYMIHLIQSLKTSYSSIGKSIATSGYLVQDSGRTLLDIPL